MYADGGAEAAELWSEVGLARDEMREHNAMRWSVPAHEGHDDFLVSLALCCEAAQGAARPAADAVIRPRRLTYREQGWERHRRTALTPNPWLTGPSAAVDVGARSP